MADISQIKLPNNSTYTLKDSNAYHIGEAVPHKTSSTSEAPVIAVPTTGTNHADYQFLHVGTAMYDYFYALHLNPDYTITCNYSGTHGSKGTVDISTLFDASPTSAIVLDVDSIASTPFVLTITKNSGNIANTEANHLQLFRRAFSEANGRLTDYKVQLYTSGSTSGLGTYNWQTVYERTGVSDKINGLCIPLNPTSYSYLMFSGVRITISGATPNDSSNTSSWVYNAIDIASLRLVNTGRSFGTAKGLGALDINGGDVYGATTFHGGITTSSISGSCLDTSISAGSTSTKIPTTQAVASFVGTAATPATTAQIKAGTDNVNMIASAHQHEAAFYGLAKAAGDTTQASSNNSVGTYTSDAKAAIQSMLDIQSNSIYVSSVSGTTPSITGQPNMRYICGEVTSISITPPQTGTAVFRFTSGTTPAVLTLPSTVKMPEWFDISTLETNTIYEILITDGVYGGVMSWPL